MHAIHKLDWNTNIREYNKLNRPILTPLHFDTRPTSDGRRTIWRVINDLHSNLFEYFI